jgi:hypothetical protein
MKDNLNIGGSFEVVYRERGKRLWRERVKNGLTSEALDMALIQIFNMADFTPFAFPPAAWKFGLIADSNFTGLANSDTIASHPGWTEFTSYAETIRPLYLAATVEDGVVSPTRPTVFTMSARGTIRGFVVVIEPSPSGGLGNVKGSADGYLWATGVAAEGRTVDKGGIITVAYSCKAAGGHQ